MPTIDVDAPSKAKVVQTGPPPQDLNKRAAILRALGLFVVVTSATAVVVGVLTSFIARRGHSAYGPAVAEVNIAIRSQRVTAYIDVSDVEPKWHLVRKMPNGAYVHVVHVNRSRYTFASPDGSYATEVKQDCDAVVETVPASLGHDAVIAMLGGRTDLDVTSVVPVSALEHEYHSAAGYFDGCSLAPNSSLASLWSMWPNEPPVPMWPLDVEAMVLTYDGDEGEEEVNASRALSEMPSLPASGSGRMLSETSAGGCCQRSASDDRCAPWEYHRGICIRLTGRSIGCTRAFWAADKDFDEASQRCVVPSPVTPIVDWDIEDGKYCTRLDKLDGALFYSHSWSNFATLDRAKASCIAHGENQCAGVVQYKPIPSWFLRCLPGSGLNSASYLTTHKRVAPPPPPPSDDWKGITCPVMAALVKNGDLIPQQIDGVDGFVSKQQTVNALLNIGISPHVVTETTDANFDGGDGPDPMINLFRMNTIVDGFGHPADGPDNPAFGGREHWRSTGIRDANGAPRKFVYDQFNRMAGDDRVFTLDEVEAAANLWDAPTGEAGPRIDCLPGESPCFPSNDMNFSAGKTSSDGKSPCTVQETMTRGACRSQLQGAIRFMHQEFGHPTGTEALMDATEMEALWLSSEYPSKFAARNPKDCAGGRFGCGTCWSTYRSAVGVDKEVQKEKFCRCMRNKDFLDPRDFEQISPAFKNTCIEDKSCSPFCFAPASGSFFGAV